MSQVLSLAKEFVKLSLSGEEPDPLTNLRLQKLLYYTQAWSLVIRESEVFSDEIEAWWHGPVVRRAYHFLPDGQGATQIDPDAFAETPDLEPEDAEFVRSVWEAYNQYSALRLFKMTHEETPWREARGDRPRDGTGNDPILIEHLEEFFRKQAVPAPLAEYHYRFRKREEEATRMLTEIPPLDIGRLAVAATSVTPSAGSRVSSGV